MVQEHVESFFTQVESETRTGLPEFVKDEFEALLKFGILAHGFYDFAVQIAPTRSLWTSRASGTDFAAPNVAWCLARATAHVVDYVSAWVPILALVSQ
ncbi:MAG: hypothetical protein ABFS45_12295 [Pseudomonadota bacterium]